MPGEIDKPDVVDKYRMRIFYSRNGGCGAVFMRKKHTSYRLFWLMADLVAMIWMGFDAFSLTSMEAIYSRDSFISILGTILQSVQYYPFTVSFLIV